MSGLRIAKFGGTSLGASELFGNVLEVIEERATRGPLVVVVSALGTVTDRLEALAEGRDVEIDVEEIRSAHGSMADRWLDEAERTDYEELLDEIADQLAAWGQFEASDLFGSTNGGVDPVRDEILAAGERLSAPLVAAALRSRGVSARSVDAADLVKARRDGGEVVVNWEATEAAIAEWWDQWDGAHVPIVTGFIAGSGDETVTLSRGGSDYSAALFARALGAEVLERWTDVPGLFEEDPDEDPDAERFDFLRFEEARRLTREGRLGMHPLTLEPLSEHPARLHVRSSRDLDAEGTVIGPVNGREHAAEPVSS